ncbi:MAG TPA: hypothetical protein VHH53_02510, partial [Pseudonocardiaceae bacterium]|nr:hypothetical protein [Pseudonocardiaceae bacterium]
PRLDTRSSCSAGWIGVVETGMGLGGGAVQDGKVVIDLDATWSPRIHLGLAQVREGQDRQ